MLLPATGTEPLTASAQATATNVGRLRRTLRDWLAQALDDDPDAFDLVLAASEALENAADHAFTRARTIGTMRVRATDHGSWVSVVVSDDGSWRQPDADPGHRRRGIGLMGCLADASRIEPTAKGTSVTLVHHRAA